ncbi:MAG: T9SS type A sorting domain-containing protein, partial [Porphyromonadaceae bacterium]|nr:T9SS type A sorting domain-containing protein [Porphyromonadaceae bacterium]
KFFSPLFFCRKNFYRTAINFNLIDWSQITDATQKDVANRREITYSKEGLYDFPEVSYTYQNAQKKSYRASGKILVGGKAEICDADMSKWRETYLVGYLPLDKNAGYLGGTNSSKMYGYGNLFLTSQKNAHLIGVNVYFKSKPTKYNKESKLLLRVWYPQEKDKHLNLTGLPIEVSYCPFDKIRKLEKDEIPLKDAAVAEFRFDKPLQIWDKPEFFVTVEGFGEDPEKEDLCMLTELMGKSLTEDQSSNLLSHNSFVKFGSKDASYEYPINYFGAKQGASFMICPIIDNLQDDPLSINAISTSDVNVSLNDGFIFIKTVSGIYNVFIYDMNGRLIRSAKIDDGIYKTNLDSGNYILSLIGNDNNHIIKKLIIK